LQVHLVHSALPERVAGPVMRERGLRRVRGDRPRVARGLGERLQVRGVAGAHGARFHVDERRRVGGGRAEQQIEEQAERCVSHEHKLRSRRAMTNDYSANGPVASVNERVSVDARRMLGLRMKKAAALAAAWLPFLVLWLLFGMQIGATFRQALPRAFYAIGTAALLGLLVSKL